MVVPVLPRPKRIKGKMFPTFFNHAQSPKKLYGPKFVIDEGAWNNHEATLGSVRVIGGNEKYPVERDVLVLSELV